MKKICTRCKQERDAEFDFNWKDKSRSVRHSRCKFCQSQLSKDHYVNNKQAYGARARARGSIIIPENRKRLIEYLMRHPCVACGQPDVRVLDFDHVRGEKHRHISQMINIACSWATIETEIAKCEVRCANCHRIKTGENISSWRHSSSDPLAELNYLDRALVGTDARYAKHKQWLRTYLLKHPCVDCGLADIRCLEFDHVRGEKSAPITKLINRLTPLEVLEAEIAKCEVRCASCHRLKTLERGSWWRHLI